METRHDALAEPARADRRGRRIGITQALTLVVATVLLVIGVNGFLVTGVDEFAHHDTGEHLLGFELNPLHNTVHIVLGLIGLVAAVRLRGAIAYGGLLAVGYGAVAVYGMFAIHEEWDVLSLNRPDNWLHLGLAAFGLVIVAVGTSELRRLSRSSFDDDDDLVIDLTIDERLRDVMPESIHAPTPGYRSTGLPTRRVPPAPPGPALAAPTTGLPILPRG